jgi:hypothetical protein
MLAAATTSTGSSYVGLSAAAGGGMGDAVTVMVTVCAVFLLASIG